MTHQPSLSGRRGVVIGVANERSIAWGIARTAASLGAELAFTYQGEAFGRRVKPLAESVGSRIVQDMDLEQKDTVDAVFERIAADWGSLDFLVHAVAWSDKRELSGRYVDTTRGNFLRSLDVSCYSFTDLARRATPLMTNGGAMLTLTYLGSGRVMPNYNVMGVAKAALESSVRYLAHDLGPLGIRVNALSPGPMRTLAGSAIGGARKVYRATAANAPLRRNVSMEEVGGAAAFLLSDLGAGITGEVMHVDSGYHALGMAIEENL